MDTALKQPETIKITLNEPQRAGRTHESSAYIVPDKGLLGPGYALIFTFPDFETKIPSRLDATAADHVAKLHNLFGRCLQCKAATHWASVISAYPAEDRTTNTFHEVQKDYLEKVISVTNIGDFVIRALKHKRKPAAVPFKDYHERREKFQRHLDSGLLRISSALATDHQKADQVFSTNPVLIIRSMLTKETKRWRMTSKSSRRPLRDVTLQM